ncbi:MAG: hypothetical protein ACRDZT_08610 [Acidimicrobiales bacterium]
MTGFRGATSYEYRMQVRNVGLWVATIVVGVIGTRFVGVSADTTRTWSVGEQIGAYAVNFNLFIPVIVGCYLADRVVRDRRLGMLEVLESSPMAGSSRLWAKFLGSTAAACTPAFVGFMLVTIAIAISRGSAGAIAYGIAAFLTVMLPGLLFVSAFSLACPVIVTPVVFRVLFFGYWFWGNLMPPAVMPTLARTPLMPLGKYAESGLFDSALRGGTYVIEGPGSLGQALVSIVLLLVLAVAAIVALQALRPRWARI